MNMSLGRLLAAGKSLVGLSGGVGRYRVNKHARLPKFIAMKNPFAPGAVSAESPATKPLSGQPAAPKPAVARADASEAGKEFFRTSLRARAVGWLGEWRQKLNPVSRPPSLSGPVKSAMSHVAPTVRQGELSLDAVQVVRNDLSDTDFEVVRRTAKPVSPVMAMTAEQLEPMGAAWNRLTTRFFGADQP
jgi:hypothetical protein